MAMQWRNKQRSKWLLFIGGIIFIVGVIIVSILNTQGINQGPWGANIGLIIAAIGVIVALATWLFPIPAEPSGAPRLFLAQKLVRESFNMGDATAANFPYLIAPIQHAYNITIQALRDASSSSPNVKHGILILGEANAGKTRLAFEALIHVLKDWPVLIWRPVYTTIDGAPTAEALRTKRLVIFIDNLQDYVPLQMKEVDPRTTTLRNFIQQLLQVVQQVVIITTCRLEDENRVRAGLGQFFIELVIVSLPHFNADIQNSETTKIITEFRSHGSTHDGDWDGTLGSLVLGLSTKRSEYLRLSAQKDPEATVLRAMKLLTAAHISAHTKRRLQAVCADVFGEIALQDERIWREAVTQLTQKEFGTEEVDTNGQEVRIVIRKDAYFDKVITDYLAQNWLPQLIQDLGKLKSVLERLMDVDALISLGIALAFLKRNEEALAVYEQAIRLDPNLALAYNNKGTMLTFLKRNEEALAVYEQAIRLDPNLALAYNNKGAMLTFLKRNEEALVAYEQAIRLDPNDASVYFNEGLVLAELHRNEEALVATRASYLLNCIEMKRPSSLMSRLFALHPTMLPPLPSKGSYLLNCIEMKRPSSLMSRLFALTPTMLVSTTTRASYLLNCIEMKRPSSLMSRLFALHPTRRVSTSTKGMCSLN